MFLATQICLIFSFILVPVTSSTDDWEKHWQCVAECDPWCNRAPVAPRTKISDADKASLRKEFNFVELNGKHYYFEAKRRLSWMGALLRCRQMGANLLNIKDQKDFDIILKHKVKERNYWTDITDVGTEHKFVSFSTGKRQQYFNWHEDEPNNLNNTEHCVEIRNSYNVNLLNDNDCDKVNYFICQM